MKIIPITPSPHQEGCYKDICSPEKCVSISLVISLPQKIITRVRGFPLHKHPWYVFLSANGTRVRYWQQTMGRRKCYIAYLPLLLPLHYAMGRIQLTSHLNRHCLYLSLPVHVVDAIFHAFPPISCSATSLPPSLSLAAVFIWSHTHKLQLIIPLLYIIITALLWL